MMDRSYVWDSLHTSINLAHNGITTQCSLPVVMCPYWLVSVLLLWETTAVVGTTADEQWALHLLSTKPWKLLCSTTLQISSN